MPPAKLRARILLPLILPFAWLWIVRQQRRILATGIPLTEDERRDAIAVGVQQPARVRLLAVGTLPFPMQSTIGLCAFYGIFIREEYWGARELRVHELAHTAQYERAGGIRPFLREYLREYLTAGYPSGALEQEAAARARSVVSD